MHRAAFVAALASSVCLALVFDAPSGAQIHRVTDEVRRADLARKSAHHRLLMVPMRDGVRLATEVYVRMNTEIDVADARQTLLDAINRGRTARGAQPLSADENLERAATDAAAAYFENPTQSQQDTVDDASASLRRFAIAYSRIGGVMAVVADVSEAGALEPVLDAGIRFVGIGVAQGTRPDTGANAIAVVIVMAWPR